VKQLGMEVARHNPTDWNEFMTVAIGEDDAEQ